MKEINPKDHAEAIATFRHAVIGPLCVRDMPRGDLAAAIRTIAAQRVRAPGATCTKTYAVPTLERWLYAYRRGGLDALRPEPRTDLGILVVGAGSHPRFVSSCARSGASTRARRLA